MPEKVKKGSLDKFFGLYPKKSTVGVYRAGIYDFLNCLYGEVRKGTAATKEEQERYGQLAEHYFTEDRDYFDDLLKFAAYMYNKPAIGARAKIAGVKEFLSYNGVELTQNQLKRLSTKLPKGKTRTAEKDLDIETLRKLLTHMDLKGKAVTLTLASSGMRIGELMQVKLSDIDLTTTPPEIVVRGEGAKSGSTRTVFISTEAKETLEEWLKVRDKYLEAAKNKANGIAKNRVKPIEDNRLFPFTAENFRSQWDNALRKSELYNKDGSTNRSQHRIHGLRKFFRSQLALSCPVDIVEALMGHEGYLTDAYRRYTQKQMGENYLKAEHHVTVSGTVDLHEIKDRLQNTQATVHGYKQIVSEQNDEIIALRTEMKELKEKLEDWNARLTQIEGSKKKIEPLLDELRAYPELKQMFDSFLTSFEHKIKILKGEEKEVVMTIDEASEVKEDKWIKIKDKG
jgi:integrase/regulator of replication initiation timing